MARFEFGVSGTSAPADWETRGGGAADVVAALLRALGYGNVFTAPPAARLCCEPIVVAAGEFARDARLADGTERGALPVGVTVCCDDPRDAEATARAVERDLRRADWTGRDAGWHLRVVAADTAAPRPLGRDGSGRWLWGFSLSLTIERDFDE
ncbi:phage tail terminator protein [Thermophilibacter mediterraneus]|uniref:phage tail terminator protein n=1 Tax=Thermophilibacter mediterraneus TaxID=1871031 RepID=UPI0032087E54